MTLRFAPSRFLILSAVVSSSLLLIPVAAMHAQTADNAQQQSPYPGSVVEQIVVHVNDQVISTSDYNKAVQDLEQQAQQHQWTEQQLYDAKATLLRDLIDQQLLLSRGKELGITGETELVKQLDQMRKDYHLNSMDDLQKAAEAQGVSWEDFKATMRNHIIEQEVIRQEVAPKIYGNISPSQIQAYYNEHKEEFEQPEQVQLSEILIPTANPDDAAQVAAAKQKADDAEAKLKGGANFATLAKSVSGGMTASSGGDLGDFKRGQLAKVLEDDTFDLKTGQYTEPIRTKQGYVILEVTQHTDAGVAPLKDVEPQIEDDIGTAKMQPALRTYLTGLRENAYIVVKDGYQDSGASPNEMQMSYSAYTPPVKKVKKRVTRARFNGRGRKVNETVAKNTRPKKEGVQKPGRKEKIRFGQAPRETLPPALNTQQQTGTQVASNDTSTVSLGAPDTADTTAETNVKEKKTRFADRSKDPKYKHRSKGPKIDPFAPPPPTQQEMATEKEQDKPLGLNGDTSKIKKKNPRKEGPKRRMSNEKKNEQPASTQPTTPAPAPAGTSSPQ